MQMLATTAQMKELDRIAIQKRGIPSLELMERAAHEVARAVVFFAAPENAYITGQILCLDGGMAV